MANNKFDTVTMRSLRAGNDGAFKHEANCNAPPTFPRICPIATMVVCDAPPHEVSWNMQRRWQVLGEKTNATSVCESLSEIEDHRHPCKSINAANVNYEALVTLK